MQPVYIFDNQEYYQALKPQVGAGFSVFSGARQRGGGLGGILGSLVKYGIPLAQKYIWPHARDAVVRTAEDLIQDRSNIKQALKRNSGNFIKSVGKSVADKLLQEGSGLSRKRKKLQSPGYSHIKAKRPKTLKKPKQIKKKLTKGKTVKKLDFISQCL